MTQNSASARAHAPGQHPDLPPPAGSVGILGWLHANLFSSIVNTLLTLLFAWLTVQFVIAVIDWFWLDAVLEVAAGCSAVQVRGLMILPPYEENPEKSRPWFGRLRELRDAATTRHPQLTLDQLSMGMSGDFEVAIEEGATIVRVGRALFGEGPKR